MLQHAQDGPVRGRTQHPLPVIISTGCGATHGRQLDRLKQPAKLEIHQRASARAQAYSLAQRWKERRRIRFDVVDAGEQPGCGIETVLVGEYLERVGSRT